MENSSMTLNPFIKIYERKCLQSSFWFAVSAGAASCNLCEIIDLAAQRRMDGGGLEPG